MNKGFKSLIETTVKGLREKTDFTGRWCENFTEECIDKLKDYAGKGTDCGKKCEYCDKFKWIINRAKHYGEKLNLNWEDILDSWEKDRRYWYLNYYQESNQPEIKGDKVKVFESVEDMLKSIGERKFRCPSCGGITTDPYKCNSGIKIGKGKNTKVCDWKVYGLFGDLGKGIYVYCKDKLKGQTIFIPISWEEK